jgi:hypothetical protein
VAPGLLYQLTLRPHAGQDLVGGAMGLVIRSDQIQTFIRTGTIRELPPPSAPSISLTGDDDSGGGGGLDAVLLGLATLLLVAAFGVWILRRVKQVERRQSGVNPTGSINVVQAVELNPAAEVGTMSTTRDAKGGEVTPAMVSFTGSLPDTQGVIDATIVAPPTLFSSPHAPFASTWTGSQPGFDPGAAQDLIPTRT